MQSASKPPFGISLEAIGRVLRQPIGRPGKTGASGTTGAASADDGAKQRSAASLRRRQMRRELYTLMEHHPATRRTMRNLDAVERTLRNGNYDSVAALPVKVLARAHAELESLVRDWSAAGLAELRSRLAVTVKERRAELTRTETIEERYSSAAPPMTAAGVTEVSHEEYDEAERSWTGRVPLEVTELMEAAQAAQAAKSAGG